MHNQPPFVQHLRFPLLQKGRQMFAGLSAPQKLLVVAMVALFLAGAIKSVYYTTVFGGADLRERIVGARALTTNQSPYYYKWMPGDPETLINPNLNRSRSISGLSVAPGTLYIHYLFSPMPYKWLRYAWLVFQYGLLAYVFLFFLRRAKSTKASLQVLFVGTLFFCCSPFWLLHVDRGQVYILYAALFCLLYQLSASQKPAKQFLAGLIFVFAVYCRPTFVVAGLPFLFRPRKPLLAGTAIGLGLGAVGLFWNLPLWQDYLEAMGAFTQLTTGLATSPSVNVTYPAVIEGMDNLTKGKLDFMCGGITPVNAWMERLNVYLPGWTYILLYALVIAALAVAFRKKLATGNVVVFSLFGFICYMMSEYIMPAPRGAYTLVQWSFAVLLILSTGRQKMMDVLLVVTGLCMMTAFPFYFPYFYGMGEALLVVATLRFIRNYNCDSAVLAYES